MNQEPKRILQVVTYMGRGGIETMLMNYYRSIDRTKVQFDFLVHRDFEADFDAEIRALGGRIYRVPPMNPLKISYWKALDDFFRSHPYEIVHCHLNYKSGVVLAAAKRAGIPVRIAHAHIASMGKNLTRLPRRIMSLLIPKSATICLACGQEAGRAVFRKMPFTFMANAIHTERFLFSEQTRLEKRGELDLSDALTLLHVGRFDYQKNHTFLLDVFAEVLKRDPNARLLLAGDGALRPDMEQKAAALPAGSVRFLGVRDDVPQLLQAADVFVFPSHFEGLPVTMVEAQAASLPCVMSANVTSECIVTDLVQSLPIDDPRVWAEAILAARGTPRTDRLADIQRSGYDITAAAEKLQRFYLNGESL